MIKFGADIFLLPQNTSKDRHQTHLQLTNYTRTMINPTNYNKTI